MRSIEATLKKISERVGGGLNVVSVCILTFLMLFVTAEVIGRAILKPVPGAFEITEYMMVGLVMFSLAYTMAVGGHVRVEVLILRLRPRIQAILASIVGLLGLAIFILAVYGGIQEGIHAWQVGSYSEELRIPQYPFKFMVPLGFLALAIATLVQFLRALGRARGQTG